MPDECPDQRSFNRFWLDFPIRSYSTIRPLTEVALAQIVRTPDGRHLVAATEVFAEAVVDRRRAGQRGSEIFSDLPALPSDAIDAVIEWAYLELGPTWMAPEANC